MPFPLRLCLLLLLLLLLLPLLPLLLLLVALLAATFPAVAAAWDRFAFVPSSADGDATAAAAGLGEPCAMLVSVRGGGKKGASAVHVLTSSWWFS
jgi:hypothetical protein